MSASRIVASFLAFGAAWILISDRVLAWLVQDSAEMLVVQSVKGLVFVLLSAALVYVLVRRTERMRAAMAADTLREKERLAHILNVSPAVIYALTPSSSGQGPFVVDFVGDEVERLTGYPVEQWFTTTHFWRDHVHPDDLAAVEQAQRTLMRDGAVHHEYRFRHADGAYIWINDNVILVRDEGGPITQIMGAWLDITERKAAELATQRSEQRYREMFEINPQPMFVYDLQTLGMLSVNSSTMAKLGYTHDEFMALTLTDVVGVDDGGRVRALVSAYLQSGGGYSQSGEWQCRKKDGTHFWVEISGHTFTFEGRPARLIQALDVTDRRQAEERLRLISNVFECTQEGIGITDAQGRYISVNRSFTAITGFASDEVIGKTPLLHRSGRHEQSFYDAMWQQIHEEGRWEGEVWNRRKSGEIYPEWLSISAITDAQGQVQQYLGIFTETSRGKAAEERIQRLVNFDILTNLPNRALLNDRAKVALAASARSPDPVVVVMHLNLDHFRRINESLGHEMGDQVLIATASRLLAVLRPDDTVSRMGGDDFIILLPHIHALDVAQVALRLMATVAEPLLIAEQSLRLTASIGIAEYPENGSDLTQLTQAAESAVNQAKREGRNTFCFVSRSMQDQVKESIAIERDLSYAVERQQLVLHYQPQVDVPSGKIIGVEALVRWQHPEWGLVAPGRFIAIAESSGLIRGIGRWVMETALTQNATWAAQGLPIVPVAVNLSMVQFKDPALRDNLVDALRVSGLPAAMVELELTESVAMEDSNFTIAAIAGLKSLGVTLSIDDFGTGYSSLSYLKRFAIDKLKIDQSFVRGLNVDPQDEAIVVTVIQLARSLGLHTIAEGVETQEQLDFLRAHACEQFQGYLFSRPVPADEFAKLLRASP
jgi:diguanylate cyclase (GGDEF)-like protein/PAS domain S-box-containing protein